ncbi:hypothetical protein [Mucilaginibacter agri]|uniref:Outer membrane protein beta-barrel domain-containing protein n=1 Tax=Mucilaginibacter agri TaxID=2695265 RepID=A0A966DTI2_9SPHI|nr:hypothetical protein [Mucilaginibacter agri]NCD69446.1 hypothetical protein [Mucilaginibacter agri]
MKYFYLLLLCSLIPAAVFSQTNFQPGYIINSTGDTTRGLIDNREWNITPNVIAFKNAKVGSTITRYKPTEIRGFNINDKEIYQTYKGYISMGRTQGTQLSYGIDTTSQKGTVFLKIIADGPHVKLYEYVDDIKARYFIQEQEQQPTELKYNVFYSNTAEDNRIVNTEIYKGQLLLLAKKYQPDNGTLLKSLAIAEYNKPKLTAIINMINNKKGEAKPSALSNFRVFAGLGASSTQGTFKQNGQFETSGLKNSIEPVISAGIDFLIKPQSQRFIVRTELLLSWSKFDFEAGHVGLINNLTASVSQRNVTIAPQVIYNFYNTQSFKIHVGAGIGINVSSYTTSKTETIDTYTQTYDHPFKFDSNWINIPVEVGVVLNKRVEILARYLFPADNTDGDYSIKVKSLMIGAHLLLGKQH